MKKIKVLIIMMIFVSACFAQEALPGDANTKADDKPYTEIYLYSWGNYEMIKPPAFWVFESEQWIPYFTTISYSPGGWIVQFVRDAWVSVKPLYADLPCKFKYLPTGEVKWGTIRVYYTSYLQ